MAGQVKTQLVIEGKNTSNKAFDEVNAQLSSMDKALGSAGAALAGFISVAALTGAVKGIANLSDQWVEMTDRLKNATGTQQGYEDSLDRLRAISARTFTSMANNAELFIGSLKPLQEAGFTSRQVLDLTEAVNLGLVASATKGERAASVIDQFNRAMQTGVLRGDAFNSMLQGAPALAQALADGLGVTRQEMIRMAEAGELNSERVIPALISQLDSLGKAVDGMNITVGDSMIRLQESINEAVGEADVEPLVNAILELGKTISDPQIRDNLAMLASALVKLAEAAIKAGAGTVKFAQDIGYVAARVSNSVTELDRANKEIEYLEAAANGFGILDLYMSDEAINKSLAAWRAYREQLLEQQTGLTTEMLFLRDVAEAAAEEAQQRELASRSKHIGELKRLQDQQLKDADRASKALLAQQRKATSDLEKIRADRLKIEQRYQEALAGMNSGGDASYGAAQALKVGARDALRAGDVEGAQAKAQAALKMLQDLQAAGENTYGFAGFIGELRDIELAANEIEQTRAEDKIAAIGVSIATLKQDAEGLKNMDVSLALDEASVQAVRTAIQNLAAQLAPVLQLPVTVGGGAAPEVSGFASGGHIRGPGTGTSDSILARLSNGEFVMRAAAVRAYGPDFMAKLNGLQIPKFADGGLIDTVSGIAPPAPGRDLGRVDLNVGGESFSLLAPGDQFDKILKRTATKFGRTHR
ncbi:phage tail protein [Stutzerimonas nosocomialis]|uniref:tape measure protein n=1 Tax=Stutzerimonas nosocomialis TaxID=1056496 RepID=UPI00110822ED|nr:tape measure protein [Stutzerimonas nosocomialis]TLX54864.1 phage tail protein [Stutzerimonas nosocomialis]